MKKIVLATLLFLAAMFAVQVVVVALSDVVKITLGRHTYLIPRHIAMEPASVMPIWLLLLSGELDDDAGQALFDFDDQEVKANVAGYQVAADNQFKDDVGGLLIALTPEEFRNYNDPEVFAQLGDLWRGTGSYKGRKVEADEMPGWYRVYRKVEYPRSWMLVSQFPDSAKNVPAKVSDFLIASCHLLGSKEKKSANCKIREFIDDVLIEFRISGYNLPVLDEVRDFVRGQVLEWRQEGSD